MYEYNILNCICLIQNIPHFQVSPVPIKMQTYKSSEMGIYKMVWNRMSFGICFSKKNTINTIYYEEPFISELQ